MAEDRKLTIDRLLAELYRRGVRLAHDGDRLRVSSPENGLDDHLAAALKEHKADILAHLRRRATAAPGPSQPVAKADRAGPLPVSFAQQRLWFLEQMQPDSAAYNLSLAVAVHGALDDEALARSLAFIGDRHEVLRTRYVSVDGKPEQRIDEQATVDLERRDLRAEADADSAVAKAARKAAARPFDLAREQPLRAAAYRTEERRWVVVFTVHHIAADAWSLDVLLQELAVVYPALLIGAAPELPDLPIQYADFVAWQQSEANRSRLDKELNYWRSRLGGELPRVQLPTDFPRPRKQTFNGAVVEFAITEATTQCLRELAREHAGSLFMVLVTALNVLLYRYSGQRDLCIGTPVANRQRAELEPLIGLFVNTLVLRTQVDPEQSFTGLLQQVRDTVLEAQAHQDVPFEHLVEALAPARDPSLSPLFQVKFRLENAPAENVQLPGLRLERQPQQLTLAKLDLSVDMYETSDGLVGGFEYNTDLFERATIERMASQFAELIARLVDEPGAPIGSIGALTAAELERQRFAWNANTETYADTSCYHQLFERAVAASPESLAVIHDGVAREQLTYDELNRRANRLAHHLIDRGAGPEAVVAICLPRSIDLVVAWLAVLKAGAAYLPLDPDYPADRLRFMLNDAGVRVLLTVSETALPGAAARVDLDRISIDDLPDDNPATAVRPDNLAYLIYTSGSTGRPKGALIAHRGLVNLTEDKIRKCDVRAGDRVLQFFSFSFDGSVPEFVMTLAAGACLVAAPAASLLPGPGLRDLLLRNEITHMTLTPSALTALPYTAFPKLRMVLVGGEAPSHELIARWSVGRRFINAYGPTETTVNASMVPCGNGHPLTPTLTPSANKQLYVLDEDLQIVPVGAVGELHIGGVGLARGYLHQAALTAERFIPNPFALGPEDARSQPDDSVLYKSGDLASYLPDGRIRIIGRVDQQTKIRGFRIELGEIERVLEQHPHVDAGVVIARDHGDDKRLIAYGVASVDDPDEPAKVRRFVAEKLPQFMVPGALVWLPELPLTSNGKLDVDALPPPGGRAQRRDTSPRSPREELLAGLFAEIIGVDRVGIDENFFDLGGHSLLATRLVSRLLEQAGIEITVMDLFEAGSVAELAQRIEQKQYLDPLLGAIEDDDEREEVAL